MAADIEQKVLVSGGAADATHVGRVNLDHRRRHSLPQAAARAAATAPFDPRRACFQSASLRQLAALGAGLVAADIDLGPYIVALTPHRVVAAPYHRLSQGILANRAILDGPLHGAEPAMRALNVDYIALGNVPAEWSMAPASPFASSCSAAGRSTFCRSWRQVPTRPCGSGSVEFLKTAGPRHAGPPRPPPQWQRLSARGYRRPGP